MNSRWEKLRKKDFPITRKYVYLDHAAGGPIPSPVKAKIDAYYNTNALKADFAWNDWVREREIVREKVAAFINADPAEITFIQSTSQGMNFIAELISREGQVLTNELEFPSSTLPWIWRKADLVFQKEQNGKIPVTALQKLLTPSVKTLVSSFVQYRTGFRQDLETLGKIKGYRFLVVNATQGFGVLPIDVQKWNADFLCTNSYKWLMAGYGSGILYIRKKWIDRFAPVSVGWRSMKVPEKMDNRLIDVREDAGRYEWGCPNFPGIFAVGAAVEYLSRIGIEKIEQRVLELTDYLIGELQARNFEILTPLERKHRSGIVVFKIPNAQALWQKLLAKGIYTSVRGGGLRVAMHFYNTFAEVDALMKALKKTG